MIRFHQMLSVGYGLYYAKDQRALNEALVLLYQEASDEEVIGLLTKGVWINYGGMMTLGYPVEVDDPANNS